MSFGFGVSFSYETMMAAVPALSLTFAGATTLDPRIDFTRASAGTYFDSTGLLVNAGYNLIFPSATLGAFVSCNVVQDTVAPDNTVTAGSVVSTVAGALSYAAMSYASFVSGTTYTASMYVKRPAATPYVFISSNSATIAPFGAIFNLDTVSLTAGTGRIQDVGGGWYRVSATGTSSASGAQSFYAVPAIDGTTVSSANIKYPTAVGQVTIVVWGVQLEVGSTATAYARTTSTASGGARFDYDPATPNGTTGVELITNGTFASGTSGWTTGANATVSVSNGILSVTRLNNENDRAYQTVSLTIGKTYKLTFSATGTTPTVAVSTSNNFGATTVYTLTSTNTFVATAATMFIGLGTSTNGATAAFSGVSAQEVTFTPKGLLIEEARTNLLTYSSDVTNAAWTKPNITATLNQVGLDGTANSASLVVDNTTNAAHYIQGTGTTVVATTYTFSAYLKQSGSLPWVIFGQDQGGTGFFTVNLSTGAFGTITTGTYTGRSITSVGNGWYRVSITYAAASTSASGCIFISGNGDSLGPTYAGTGTNGFIVYGAQLEAGAFATSYIPTVASTVTRAADVAQMTGTNFSSWFNQSAGTFVAETIDCMSGSSAPIFQVDNGSATGNRYLLYFTSATTVWFYTEPSAAVISSTIASLASSNKCASAYNGSFINATANGAVPTQTAATAPTTQTRMNIGGLAGSALNGHIRRISYYNTRLTNAQLQALTT